MSQAIGPSQLWVSPKLGAPIPRSGHYRSTRPACDGRSGRRVISAQDQSYPSHRRRGHLEVASDLTVIETVVRHRSEREPGCGAQLLEDAPMLFSHPGDGGVRFRNWRSSKVHRGQSTADTRRLYVKDASGSQFAELCAGARHREIAGHDANLGGRGAFRSRVPSTKPILQWSAATE